jgi:hypothetical protein
MFTGRLELTHALVELAQAEVAVGGEGMHAELVGQGESLPVVAFGLRNVDGTLMRGNLAEEAEGPRLVAALAALVSYGSGSPGEFESVIESVGEYVHFTQIHEERRPESSESHSLDGAQGALQQRDTFGNASRQGVGVAQDPRVLR